MPMTGEKKEANNQNSIIGETTEAITKSLLPHGFREPSDTPTLPTNHLTLSHKAWAGHKTGVHTPELSSSKSAPKTTQSLVEDLDLFQDVMNWQDKVYKIWGKTHLLIHLDTKAGARRIVRIKRHTELQDHKDLLDKAIDWVRDSVDNEGGGGDQKAGKVLII